MRRSRLPRWLSVLNQVRSKSAHPSTLLAVLRFGYLGSTTSGRRNQPLTVFLDRPVRLVTSRNDIPSLKCIRLTLANIPTSITPCSPAHLSSGAVNHVGQFCVNITP